MGFGPQETDTMAAARSDDEEAATKKSEVVEETDTMAARGNDGEASITTNDATAAASAIAAEASRVQRGVVEDGGSKAENDEASGDVKWRIKRNNRRIGKAHVGTRGRRERVSRGAELENPVGRREKIG